MVFLAILAASFFAFFTTSRLIGTSSRVEKSQALLIETNQYLSELKDIESGGRGYFLTGDQRYVRTQQAGIAASQATAKRLHRLADGRVDPQRIARLFRLADERVGYSLQLIQQRNAPASARQSIRQGSRVMDRIRSEAAAIIDSERAQYRLERENRETQAWIAGVALAVTITFCLLAIAWLFTLRGREIERHRKLADELQALNFELDTRVAERTAQLRVSEERSGLIIDSALDAVISIDETGAITAWNPQAQRIFGWKREEVMGRPIDETVMPERYRQAHRAGLERYLATGEARVLNKRIELVALRRGGEEFPIEISITPIHENGTASFSAFIRDITDGKARDEQLRQLQRMDAIGRLTGGVAHDFNNLLAIVHGNAELIRDKLEEGTEIAEMADDVIGAAARGADVVRRLLAFARMQHLESVAVDLNARLPNVIGLLQRVLGENIQVQVRMADELWAAVVDPTQVDDALLNLAINARDAMPDGGTLTIETQNVHLDEDYASHHLEVAPGDYVMLAVSDTGTGMPPDVIARAFEPFFTTKAEGQGTGLGLSQIFGWIKQSGGHIKIYSEVDHGTTIKLYLPRAESIGAPAQAIADAVDLGGNETILVVEDNPNVRKTVIRQLHDLGYETLEAESGSSARQLVEDGAQFDLLLTDIVMPGGITGYQLVDELRKDRPDLKVLFTSGYTELARSSDQAIQKYPLLSKPYRKQDLGRAVRAVLDQSREPGTTSSS